MKFWRTTYPVKAFFRTEWRSVLLPKCGVEFWLVVRVFRPDNFVDDWANGFSGNVVRSDGFDSRIHRSCSPNEVIEVIYAGVSEIELLLACKESDRRAVFAHRFHLDQSVASIEFE